MRSRPLRRGSTLNTRGTVATALAAVGLCLLLWFVLLPMMRWFG